MLRELLQFFFNLFKRKKGISENTEFKKYYNALTKETYEAHSDYNLNPHRVLIDGLPSDCEDRANSLAQKALDLGYTPFMLVLQWEDTGHMAVFIEEKVFDPTHNYYSIDLKKYLEMEKPIYKFMYPYAGV